MTEHFKFLGYDISQWARMLAISSETGFADVATAHVIIYYCTYNRDTTYIMSGPYLSTDTDKLIFKNEEDFEIKLQQAADSIAIILIEKELDKKVIEAIDAMTAAIINTGVLSNEIKPQKQSTISPTDWERCYDVPF